ncbi:MAG: YqeG family HAD IIIA-type phosphatase [Oscillospiraceae bacterium]|nr:YqeG family HAD IIIA-type phosphatase [Oscillospiraceae bacterium]
MSFSPIPDLVARDVFQITPTLLQKRGITLLLLDLDNTLAPYSEDLPRERILTWMKELRDAGIELYLISNSRKSSRADDYAEAADIPFIKRAGKPNPRALHAAMEELGKTPAETALMGDQIFTDGMAANRAGATSIVVRPIEMNAFHVLRYGIEQPLRAFAKEKLR